MTESVHTRLNKAWEKFVETYGPLAVLKDDIDKHTYFKPSHILLSTRTWEDPLPAEYTRLELFGIPVIWTDALVAPSLVYTPTKKEI